MKLKFLTVLVFSAAFSLVGCGNSGGGSNSPSSSEQDKGDSNLPVEGIWYYTSVNHGVTNVIVENITASQISLCTTDSFRPTNLEVATNYQFQNNTVTATFGRDSLATVQTYDPATKTLTTSLVGKTEKFVLNQATQSQIDTISTECGFGSNYQPFLGSHPRVQDGIWVSRKAFPYGYKADVIIALNFTSAKSVNFCSFFADVGTYNQADRSIILSRVLDYGFDENNHNVIFLQNNGKVITGTYQAATTGSTADEKILSGLNHAPQFVHDPALTSWNQLPQGCQQ